MSEQLLKAIIHLLAIVAKEDDVTEDERNSIEDFLLENLSKGDSLKYMQLFDQMTSHMSSERAVSFSEKKEISILAKQVNQELTQQQKIVVILKVLEVIMADGEISDREQELLLLIGEAFHFSNKAVDHIKSFVVTKERSQLNAENILIIDDSQNGGLNSSSKHIKRAFLSGYLAFFRLPALEMYFMKYMGESALTLNGIHVRKNKIIVFSSGSTIRSSKIDPIYYSDVVSAFREEGSQAKISFVAENLGFTFPNGHQGLRDITIAESSGKLIGLMGGSGAGKSTLLNVLNGNEKPSHGSVRINGIDINKDKSKVEGVIGYVPQDDLLVEELSVSENLYYAAKLCFANKNDKELNELVDKTLSALGLSETRNLKVGSPLQKTISGGQRKRLNIGLELLREPSVMFVDEPTSGLSSRDSENIMDLLKELSLKGKMIFVVIHQPSSEIFKMFDKLVILDVGGYQIYYGNPVEAVIYFKNIVDLIDKEAGSCIECGNVNSEQIFNIIETKVVDEYGKLTDQRKISPQDWNGYFTERVNIKPAKESDEEPEKTLKIPSRFKQLVIFASRDIASKISNKQYLAINLLEAPLLALILAFIIRYVPEGSSEYVFKENPNIPAFFFMAIIVSLFMGLTVSAEEIFKDRKILKRESFLNLSRWSYLVSKMAILFGLSALQSLMFVVIGDAILGIHGMTFSFWLVMFSVSCFANIMGLNISSAFNSAVTIYILIPLLIIPQLILSGVVVNFDKLHPWLSNSKKVPIIGELMASKWGYEALAVTQFKDNAYEKHLFEYDQTIANSEFKSVYFYSAIEANLDYVHSNFGSTDSDKKQMVDDKLKLIQNELRKEMELARIPKDKFRELENISLSKFDTSTYDATKRFVQIMRKIYNNRLKQASADRDALIKSMTDTEEKAAAFAELRKGNENEAITFFLKNSTAENRLLETKKELIQKIYPIYYVALPQHALDMRSHFYAPQKYFMGNYYDTLYFNVIVIWLMSLLLVVSLYFDWFRKVVNSFGK
ncbi:ATP-binding cassette domain-containing protein [Reichenbachiella carrageenanivorans]|uniref:ATP-binding cassette domain-containing protein n=1 Tax=Reichenbachiella carrageenanivorans TaxID=2979869 RepID=A0ABY6CVX6_9BACT|nr:ATP-binding cassette domain-containing protein [Reichenbachiella carrageenanivorans]UXX78055.1 ATP-binding cassette domain-containing protein [Reichenbachiella carrageenanivorans]